MCVQQCSRDEQTWMWLINKTRRILQTEGEKHHGKYIGRVSERTVCDPFFKHATVGYVVTWLRSFTNGSCSVTMQPCLVNWLQLRLRPVTKVSYRNQVSYRNRMGLRGNGNWMVIWGGCLALTLEEGVSHWQSHKVTRLRGYVVTPRNQVTKLP